MLRILSILNLIICKYKRCPVLTIWILMFAPSCVNCFTFTDKYSLSQGSHHKERNIKKCHIKEKNKKSERNIRYYNNLIDWFILWCLTPLFSNISAISWRPVLVMEESGVPGENHRPWGTNWCTFLVIYKTGRETMPYWW